MFCKLKKKQENHWENPISTYAPKLNKVFDCNIIQSVGKPKLQNKEPAAAQRNNLAEQRRGGHNQLVDPRVAHPAAS